MSIYASKDFWTGAGERALKTVAQAALAVMSMTGFDLIQADWLGIISTIITAAILSLLTSIATPTQAATTSTGSVSVVDLEGADTTHLRE